MDASYFDIDRSFKSLNRKLENKVKARVVRLLGVKHSNDGWNFGYTTGKTKVELVRIHRNREQTDKNDTLTQEESGDQQYNDTINQ